MQVLILPLGWTLRKTLWHWRYQNQKSDELKMKVRTILLWRSQRITQRNIERENESQAQQGYEGDLAVHATLKYVNGWSEQRQILCPWQRLHFRQVLAKTLSEPNWLYPHILTHMLGNSHQQQLFSFCFQIPQSSAALALTPQLSPFIWLPFRAYSFCTPSALCKASYDKATEDKLETSASVMD